MEVVALKKHGNKLVAAGSIALFGSCMYYFY